MNINDNCSLINNEGVSYISFNRLRDIDFIKHAFSTKKGGVSKGIFESMNLSFNRGDNKECVEENYRRFFKATGMTLENIVMSDQVHETDIYVVNEDNIGQFSKVFSERRLEKIDGMVTNLKNVPLATYYADCVPLYFVDPTNKAIGLSHAGWRGTVSLIGRKTVEVMKREYGSKPEDIIAVIGPSICRKCYEVSREVIDHAEKALDNKALEYDIYDIKDNDKYQLDLWKLNKTILLLSGLKEENIIVSGICTSCHSDLLFSHRVTNGKRGNLMAVMEIR